MIPMTDALSLIEKHRGDAVVFSTMTGGSTWRDVSGNEALDLPISGAMGKASSIALGLSLARPDKKIIVVDGDGSLLMNLGSLVTIGGKGPENLYHFVINNEVYAVTGGQPVPNAGGYTFAGLAQNAGYAAAFEFDDLEDFATSLNEVMSTRGPVMVSLKTVPEIVETPIALRARPARRTPQAVHEVRETLTG